MMLKQGSKSAEGKSAETVSYNRGKTNMNKSRKDKKVEVKLKDGTYIYGVLESLNDRFLKVKSGYKPTFFRDIGVWYETPRRKNDDVFDFIVPTKSVIEIKYTK